MIQFQVGGKTRISLADRAYNALVTGITQLKYPPGSVLGEKALVEDLNIGRTPIREALQRLALEGLVVHQLNRGMFVSEITYKDVQEIYEFRSLIDGYACRLAAERATAEQAKSLYLNHLELLAATQDNDIDRYVLADREFYSVLSEACGNSFIAETIPRIFNLHLRLWFFISSKRGNWHSIAESHEVMTKAVAEAIKQKDPDQAEFAMKSYVSQRIEDLQGKI